MMVVMTSAAVVMAVGIYQSILLILVDNNQAVGFDALL